MHRLSNRKCCYSKRLVRFDPGPEQSRSICLMEVSIAVDYIIAIRTMYAKYSTEQIVQVNSTIQSNYYYNEVLYVNRTKFTLNARGNRVIK